jgi:DNA-binding helix-hairpin-helix protein with protein kinase domain
MDTIGLFTGTAYRTGPLVARAGEGAVYRVTGRAWLLLKIFDRSPTPKQVEKLKHLTGLTRKPDHTALPVELVCDPATGAVVGYLQPYFRAAEPLAVLFDAPADRLPPLGSCVRAVRLLGEAFDRIHTANLVVGDVAHGNFLLGRDWLGRPALVYSIDCNSYQLTVRTARGNELFPSGVATESYAAPEVQGTDWSTSLRSVYSDSFGLGVLAWKIIFRGAHPFSVVTPRHVDVPPLGARIEKRLFPWRPGSPLPPDWTQPTLTPPLSVLPSDVRELFFRTFAAADPRDRPTAAAWVQAFRAWESALLPSLPFRVLAAGTGPGLERAAGQLLRVRPYAGRIAVFTGLVALTVLVPRTPAPRPLPSLTSEPVSPFRAGTPPPAIPAKPSRPRRIDPDLFPDALRVPFAPAEGGP